MQKICRRRLCSYYTRLDRIAPNEPTELDTRNSVAAAGLVLFNAKRGLVCFVENFGDVKVAVGRECSRRHDTYLCACTYLYQLYPVCKCQLCIKIGWTLYIYKYTSTIIPLPWLSDRCTTWPTAAKQARRHATSVRTATRCADGHRSDLQKHYFQFFSFVKPNTIDSRLLEFFSWPLTFLSGVWFA